MYAEIAVDRSLVDDSVAREAAEEINRGLMDRQRGTARFDAGALLITIRMDEGSSEKGVHGEAVGIIDRTLDELGVHDYARRYRRLDVLPT